MNSGLFPEFELSSFILFESLDVLLFAWKVAYSKVIYLIAKLQYVPFSSYKNSQFLFWIKEAIKNFKF